MFKQIILGLLGIVAGYLILSHSDKVKNFVGDIGWAENFFGSGGSYTAVKLLGILAGIWGFMYMTGTWQAFMKGIFSTIFSS